jgi:hypothetical protein
LIYFHNLKNTYMISIFFLKIRVLVSDRKLWCNQKFKAAILNLGYAT